MGIQGSAMRGVVDGGVTMRMPTRRQSELR